MFSLFLSTLPRRAFELSASLARFMHAILSFALVRSLCMLNDLRAHISSSPPFSFCLLLWLFTYTFFFVHFTSPIVCIYIFFSCLFLLKSFESRAFSLFSIPTSYRIAESIIFKIENFFFRNYYKCKFIVFIQCYCILTILQVT